MMLPVSLLSVCMCVRACVPGGGGMHVYGGVRACVRACVPVHACIVTLFVSVLYNTTSVRHCACYTICVLGVSMLMLRASPTSLKATLSGGRWILN